MYTLYTKLLLYMTFALFDYIGQGQFYKNNKTSYYKWVLVKLGEFFSHEITQGTQGTTEIHFLHM